MSFRRIYAKCDVTSDVYYIIILISMIQYIFNDISVAFSDFPTLKIMRVILHGIRHVNGIFLIFCS